MNEVVSEAFVRFFVEIMGHYSLFMIPTEREERSLQREAFRKSVSSKSLRRFLEVFMETQMFGGFIQERELRKQGAKGEQPLSVEGARSVLELNVALASYRFHMKAVSFKDTRRGASFWDLQNF